MELRSRACSFNIYIGFYAYCILRHLELSILSVHRRIAHVTVQLFVSAVLVHLCQVLEKHLHVCTDISVMVQ